MYVEVDFTNHPSQSTNVIVEIVAVVLAVLDHKLNAKTTFRAVCELDEAERLHDLHYAYITLLKAQREGEVVGHLRLRVK